MTYWEYSLPQLLTAQTAKLTVLIRACHLPENKTANVYTDCSNALGVGHDMLQNYFQLPLASLLKTVNKSQLVDPSHLPSYPLLKSQDFLKQTIRRLEELQKQLHYMQPHRGKTPARSWWPLYFWPSDSTDGACKEKTWQQKGYSLNSQSHLWLGPIGKPLRSFKCPTPLLEYTPTNSLDQEKVYSPGVNSVIGSLPNNNSQGILEILYLSQTQPCETLHGTWDLYLFTKWVIGILEIQLYSKSSNTRI